MAVKENVRSEHEFGLVKIIMQHTLFRCDSDPLWRLSCCGRADCCCDGAPPPPAVLFRRGHRAQRGRRPRDLPGGRVGRQGSRAADRRRRRYRTVADRRHRRRCCHSRAAAAAAVLGDENCSGHIDSSLCAAIGRLGRDRASEIPTVIEKGGDKEDRGWRIWDQGPNSYIAVELGGLPAVGNRETPGVGDGTDGGWGRIAESIYLRHFRAGHVFCQVKQREQNQANVKQTMFLLRRCMWDQSAEATKFQRHTEERAVSSSASRRATGVEACTMFSRRQCRRQLM